MRVAGRHRPADGAGRHLAERTADGPVERDEYVAQTSVAAGHLGVLDPPQTEDELNATLAAYAPELRGTDAARDAIRFLVWHPDLPLAARPAYLSLVGAAVSLTPESALSLIHI